MQDRGLKIVHMHRVAGDIVSEVVRLAVDEARLHPSPGHPDREGPSVMVATILGRVYLALDIRRTAEFPGPNHQRVLQQTAHPQILDQRPGGHVGVVALHPQLLR